MRTILDINSKAVYRRVSGPRFAARAVRFATCAFSRLGARKGMLALADQFFVSGVNFATAVMIGRMCSRAELGAYYLGWTIVLFLRGVQSNIVCYPYTVRRNRLEEDRQASYAGSALAHQLMISGISVILLAAMAGVLALGSGPAAVRPVLWILLIVLPLMLLREFGRQIAFAHLKMGLAVAMDACVGVVQLGGLLVLAHFELLSVRSAYAVAGVACLAAFGLWSLLWKEPFRVEAKRLGEDLRRNWIVGKWALASQVAGLSLYALPWILALSHGEGATGTFGACASLVGLMIPIVLGLNNFILPRAACAYAAGGVGELRHVMLRSSMAFVAMLTPLCLLAAFMGDFFAEITFGDKYVGVGLIITILSIDTLIDSLGLTANGGAWAIQSTRTIFIADVVQLAVMATAAFALIFPLGVLGAALARLVGRASGTAARWLMLRRLLVAGCRQREAI